MPMGNKSLELKFEDIETSSPELSVADGCCQDTTAVGIPGSVLTTKLSGMFMNTGFSSSVFKHNVYFYKNLVLLPVDSDTSYAKVLSDTPLFTISNKCILRSYFPLAWKIEIQELSVKEPYL